MDELALLFRRLLDLILDDGRGEEVLDVPFVVPTTSARADQSLVMPGPVVIVVLV